MLGSELLARENIEVPPRPRFSRFILTDGRYKRTTAARCQRRSDQPLAKNCATPFELIPCCQLTQTDLPGSC